MPDVFLYGGEPAPNDVRLGDPTVLRGGVAPPVAWVPLSTVVPRQAAAFRQASLWFGVFDTPAVQAAVWVPGQVTPTPRAALRVTPAVPAFPFTTPAATVDAWVPAIPATPARTPAVAPMSRVILVGADTPAIAADLPPWMQSADAAARLTHIRDTPASRFILVAPPEAPPAPVATAHSFPGAYIEIPRYLDDDDALTLILALT